MTRSSHKLEVSRARFSVTWAAPCQFLVSRYCTKFSTTSILQWPSSTRWLGCCRISTCFYCREEVFIRMRLFFLAKFPTGTSERTLSLLTYSLLPLQHFRNRRRNSLGPLHHCLLTLPFSRGGSDQLRRALKLQIASWSSCGKYISERKMKLLMAKHHPKTWEADR